MATNQQSPSIRLDLTKEEYLMLKARLTLDGQSVSGWFTERARQFLKRNKSIGAEGESEITQDLSSCGIDNNAAKD